MPANLKIEQKRFVDTVATYYETTEEESVNTASAATSMKATTPPGGNATAKAQKTAQSRKTKYGPGAMSKAALTKVRKPNEQR